MAFSSTVVPTGHASRYLQQLCKHFAHKIPVDFTPERGECAFVCGVARMQAHADALHIDIEATDARQMGQTQEIIASHLSRFAFREGLAPLEWKEGTP